MSAMDQEKIEETNAKSRRVSVPDVFGYNH